ncbi:MAG: quinoprotein dehydrogenase-associated putative ABC transporter substrate-binding protein [Methylococcales bacterium]|nr:quinoprotein dehydrogenase-associated putative ABC transporter substrate-binding protein [Methylococcales bacterium]
MLKFFALALGLTLMNTAWAGPKQDTFRVCADPLHPPYSTREQSGFENKIAELFAKKLGQTVAYTWFPERIGFIRNTLMATIDDTDTYRCDVVMGVPAGYDRTLTTQPYFHSTYVLLIAQNRGWDDINEPRQLAELPLKRQNRLKIAMFDRGPGTQWLQRQGLLDQGIPYQTMSGDHEHNIAMRIDEDMRAGLIDMAILWGPLAGHVLDQSPEGSYQALPMISSPGMKFDFSIAMGVRYGDKARQQQLNRLIETNQAQINAILREYHFPLLPIPAVQPRQDDD